MLLSLAVLGGVAQIASAAPVESYKPTDDVFFRSGLAYTSVGQTSNRLGKGSYVASSSHDGYLAVFNAATIKSNLESELGFTIDDVGDLANVTATWNLKWSGSADGSDLAEYTPAVFRTGTVGPHPTRADFYFADHGNSAINTADPANIPWTNLAGTAVGDFSDVNTAIRNASSTVWGTRDANSHKPFELDDAVLFALLTDSLSRGLTMVAANTTPNNHNIFGVNSTDANDPFLQITVVPEPAAVSLLALGGLMALRRRRQA
jgi:hypothetical protein